MFLKSLISLVVAGLILTGFNPYASAFLDGIDIGSAHDPGLEEIRRESARLDAPELIAQARSGDMMSALNQAIGQASSSNNFLEQILSTFVAGSINLALGSSSGNSANVDQGMGFFSGILQLIGSVLSSNSGIFSSIGQVIAPGGTTGCTTSVLPSPPGSEATGPAAIASLAQELSILETENHAGAPGASPSVPAGSLGATNGILNVPPISQYLNENIVVHNGRRTDFRGSWCGPVSVRMCAEYYGITGNSSYQYAIWCDYTFAQRSGTPFPGMANTVRNRLNLTGSQKTSSGTLTWLREALRAGHPVILLCNVRWRGHYIVITGIIGDTVHVNDPGTRQSNVKRTFSLSEVTRMWSSRGNRGLMVAR